MSWYSIVRRGGTTSAPWDPSQLASLLSQYDADAESLSDNASVTTLTDRAGSHDMTGAATFKTGIINGRNVYRYNGTSDGHSIGANNILDAAAGFWLFTVCATDVPANTQSIYVYRDPNGQYPNPTFEVRESKLRAITQRAPNLGLAVWAPFDALTAGVPVVAGMFCDGTDLYVRKNGATIASESFAGGTLNAGQSLGTSVGYDVRKGGVHFDGDIAEVVIGSADIQTAEAEKIEGYLAHKWGLTANLPVGHPYKTTAPTA